jgi:hypothetical protein
MRLFLFELFARWGDGTIPERERFRLHEIKGPLFAQAVEMEMGLLCRSAASLMICV